MRPYDNQVGSLERRATSLCADEPFRDRQFLATDPRDVTSMPPRLQSLLGYSVGSPFLGWVDGKHPFSRFRKNADGSSSVEYFKRLSSEEMLEWERSGGKTKVSGIQGSKPKI